MDYQRLVKELRVKLILSQQELADLLNVSFASINRWETGKHEPTIKVKRKLNELFIKNNIKGDDESNGKK
ncbi:MAG TPA: helix-turn-helix transcriptional regulator [Paludibacter sp.]|nr:helix-turn-helix transcriptional regulator [Paludibacter sp.]